MSLPHEDPRRHPTRYGAVASDALLGEYATGIDQE